MRHVFVLLALLGVNADGAEKPNVLFIAIDDMNDWTGFLGGHLQAQTPNLDRLARKGVNFINAHCSAPGCSPSRNSLLYGVEPFHSGLYAFYDQDAFSSKVLEGRVSLPELLKVNGYKTYGAGKIHHRRVPTDKEWTEYATDTKMEKLRFADNEGYGTGKMSFRPTLNPLEDHLDYQNASYGVEVLGREHEEPFFLAVGIIKPHLPFNAPKRFFDLYPAQIEPPRIHPDDHDDIPAVGRAFAKIKDDKKFKKDKAWTKVRRAYLACISWADYNVGRLLDALEASSHAHNTIVVLWSDHGYGQGEKRHFRKFALWEETTRVPFIIWDTREKKEVLGREVRDGVSLINIYRTLGEISGINVPDKVDGFSLVPQLKDPQTPFPEPSICSWGRGNYTIRDRDWRYTRYYDNGEELYSHADDPDEWTNLANDPKHAEVRNRLASHLPEREVPMVTEGLEGWSIPVSADKPLEKRAKSKSGERLK